MSGQDVIELLKESLNSAEMCRILQDSAFCEMHGFSAAAVKDALHILGAIEE